MFASQETQKYQKNKLSKRQEFRFNIRKNHIDSYMAQQRAKLVAQNNRQLNDPQQIQSQNYQKNQGNIQAVQNQIDAFLKEENNVVPKLIAFDFRNICNYQWKILSNQFQQKLDPLQISNIKYMSKVISRTNKLQYFFIENYLKAFKGQEGQNLIKKIVNDQKDQNAKQKSIDFCIASIELFNCYLNKFIKQQHIDNINQQAPVFGVSQDQVYMIIDIACQFWNGKIDTLLFAQLVSNLCRFRIKEMQSKLVVAIDSLMYQKTHFFILEAVCFGINNYFSHQNMLKIVLHPKFTELIKQGFELESICKIKTMAIIRQLLYNQNQDIRIKDFLVHQIPLFRKLLLEGISEWNDDKIIQQQLLECTNAFGQVPGDNVVDFLMQIDFVRWLQHLCSYQLKRELFRVIKNVLEEHLQVKELFLKFINQPRLLNVIYQIRNNTTIYQEILFELAQIIVKQFELNHIYPGSDITQQIVLGLEKTKYQDTQIFEKIEIIYFNPLQKREQSL